MVVGPLEEVEHVPGIGVAARQGGDMEKGPERRPAFAGRKLRRLEDGPKIDVDGEFVLPVVLLKTRSALLRETGGPAEEFRGGGLLAAAADREDQGQKKVHVFILSMGRRRSRNSCARRKLIGIQGSL